MKPRCARTCRGWRAAGKAHAPVRRITSSSSASQTTLGLLQEPSCARCTTRSAQPSGHRCRSGIRLQPAKLDEDFVGRTVELRRIGKLLAQDDCRLICLIGPGGVGKTRLAQRAMQRVRSRVFRTAQSFVPLEDIASSNELGGRACARAWASSGRQPDPLDQVTQVSARAADAARARQLRAADHAMHRFSNSCCKAVPTAQDHRHFARAPRAVDGVAAAARRAAVSGARGSGSIRSVRCGALVRQGCAACRAGIGRHRRKRRRSSTSAGRSKDLRWRCSLPRHGHACCRAKRSLPSCVAAPSFCMLSTQRIRHGTRVIEVVFDQSWRLLTRDRARRTVSALGFSRRVLGRCCARRGRCSAAGARCAGRQIAGAQGWSTHPSASVGSATSLRAPWRKPGACGHAGGTRRVLPPAADAMQAGRRQPVSVRR